MAETPHTFAKLQIKADDVNPHRTRVFLNDRDISYCTHSVQFIMDVDGGSNRAILELAVSETDIEAPVSVVLDRMGVPADAHESLMKLVAERNEKPVEVKMSGEVKALTKIAPGFGEQGFKYL